MKFIRVSTPLLFVAALAGAVALAPAAMADPPDVCSLLAAGQGYMDVVLKLEPYYPNEDVFYVEKYVDATERAQCPQYLNGPSGGGGLYPGSGPIVNGQGGWS
jgi:hypothetical protein